MLRILALVACLLLVSPATAVAGTTSAGTSPRPTADPSAATPSAARPGPPPRGSAPDGSTVGGSRLAARSVLTADGTPPLPPGIGAQGWLVADAGTGEVLAARDPHGRYYPASTLKTLLLLTLEPLLDPHRVVVGTVEDENIEGSRVGLIRGGRYPVSLLFQALVLQSGNDAANALARTAGGVPATVAAMNETATAIGAYDTVAGTPSGLDMAGQSSSPYDLALIFRRLLARPDSAAVLRLPAARMPAVPGRSPGFQFQSQNPLLHSYPGDLGGKTGFTDAARHTFVTAAERGGRRIVVTLMDTENRPVHFAVQAARLLDWGFSVPRRTTGIGVLVDSGALPPAPAPSPVSDTHRPQPPTAAAAFPPAAMTGGLATLGVLVLGGVALSVRARVRRSSSP
ncbi:MAG: hypothetical protein QOJ68_3359 [Blastococcus sp.]|nr:hypothetical protein [Blastococcus sp.]